VTTWNPADKSANVTLSNGDLTATGQAETVGTVYAWARSTTSKTAGKLYVESTVGNTDGGGFAAALGTALASSDLANYLGRLANESAYYDTGEVYVNNAVATTLATYTDGDVIGVAIDLDAGKGWYSKNGVFASGDPVAGTGAHFTFTPSTALFVGFTTADETPAHVFTANFGATAFANAQPSGFDAWDYVSQVNTAAKRFNMMDWEQVFAPGMVEPDDNDFDSFGERLAALALYCGIQPDGAAPPVVPSAFHKYALKSVGRMMGYG
jgi:hypothetical protein